MIENPFYVILFYKGKKRIVLKSLLHRQSGYHIFSMSEKKMQIQFIRQFVFTVISINLLHKYHDHAFIVATIMKKGVARKNDPLSSNFPLMAE